MSFRLTEIESWPECLEIIVEGDVDLLAAAQLEDVLEHAVASDHLYVLVDLDRSKSIDLVAVKSLVLAYLRLSDLGQEFLIFGARDGVRSSIEAVGAFDGDVLRPAEDSPPDPGAIGAAAPSSVEPGPLRALRRLRARVGNPRR